MHVVVFPGWYPGRVDKLSGDFIQRHMQATAKYCRVSVIVPAKDHTASREDAVTVKNGNLTEIYYYYPSVSSVQWLDGLLSFIRYNYFCISTALRLHKTEPVTLVHLYVLQKNYLVGFILRWLLKIPFVVSEQSTLYVDSRFDKMSRAQKSVLRLVFNEAASFHAVSKYLANSLKTKMGLNKDAVVIPNVVDRDLFFYNHHLSANTITFVHVSNMAHQKNVEGMLHAFAEVKKVNAGFVLNLVGPLPQNIADLIVKLDLQKNITVWNERDYKEVASIMQQSDAFVFFTRHETFGCVIIEANACGLPVIVTDLDVTRELIAENFNGVFVQSENVEELSEKILFTIENISKFDPVAISLQTRHKFNYDRVGKLFYDWYKSVG